MHRDFLAFSTFQFTTSTSGQNYFICTIANDVCTCLNVELPTYIEYPASLGSAKLFLAQPCPDALTSALQVSSRTTFLV